MCPVIMMVDDHVSNEGNDGLEDDGKQHGSLHFMG